jgi:hypothetical protein
LWIAPGLWSPQTANDLRACSSVLCIIAERTPGARGYRNAMDDLINATMDRIAGTVEPRGGGTGGGGESSLPSDHTPRVPSNTLLAHIQITPNTLSPLCCEGGDAAWQMLSQMTNVEEDVTRQYWQQPGNPTVPLGELDQLNEATPQDYWWP